MFLPHEQRQVPTMMECTHTQTGRLLGFTTSPWGCRCCQHENPAVTATAAYLWVSPHRNAHSWRKTVDLANSVCNMASCIDQLGLEKASDSSVISSPGS
ncbi:hypothetical protein PoB_000997300 [Plakobranchus ocellatus]|uniref:Uncharacterized protein n=1 Tax=Plakobranchus ocellatus TaxID=259542 RepID=A0AAV3YMJ0_9GAST|nr:hypothetical protein PoB_000997300 [Plakobranchus ocellatus]